MRFIVYTTTPFSGTSHDLLRGGDAPADQIAIQADAGETAIAAPAAWGGQSGLGWVYNSATEEISFIAAPGGLPIGPDGLAAIHAQVRSYLRRTDWTQLPDAPLTSTEVTDYADWREDLRTGAASISAGSTSGFGINSEIPLPPGDVFDEEF